MNRRAFLTSVAAVAVSPAFTAFARVACGPFYNGVQACEAGIQSSLLAVSAVQRMPEWCWAACIETVFAYYGHRVPQEQIVRETWGQIVNLPGQPEQIIRDLNRDWTDVNGETFSVSGDVFSANPITAAQDLSEDMPLIIGTMGHAMVLSSLTYLRNAYGQGEVKAAVVRDPWPGRGRRVLTPQEWYGTQFLARIRVE